MTLQEANEVLIENFSTGEANNLNALARRVFAGNLEAGWWTPEDMNQLERRGPGGKYTKESATLMSSKMALIHSELSEALEGMRKGLMDDHLPHRSMFEVEMVDLLIRTFDLAGFAGLDLTGAFEEKLAYNSRRMDHKLEHRNGEGGKTI